MIEVIIFTLFKELSVYFSGGDEENNGSVGTVACVPVGFRTDKLLIRVRSATASVSLLVITACSKCDEV